MIICANTSQWFKSLPLIIYITFGFAIISHLALSILGIINIRLNNPQYAEYKVLRQEEIEKSKNKKNNDKKTSLKTKLTLFIIGTISIILFSFMVLILRRYQNLITETVTEAGRTTAEQTAAIYETAEGKYEKILYFFNQQKKSNEYADTPFERIDIIISSVNAQIFMEEIKVDPFSQYEEVLCRDGIKRRIYPAKLKHKDLIKKLTPKFNDIFILENVFGISSVDTNNANDSWDAMMELLVLAFDEKYTKEEIEEFLDFSIAPKVFEVFYGLSSLKKKQQMKMDK